MFNRLFIQEPFGICKKCGFYVTKVNNIRVFRQIFMDGYICDNCGEIKEDTLIRGAIRKGNPPVKEGA